MSQEEEVGSVMSIADELPWMEGVPKAVACSAGWDDLIRRLHSRLVGIDPDYRVVQVKEKFGGLRYYIEPSPGLDDLLCRRLFDVEYEAEAESLHICEVCGEPGEIRGGSWYRTLCDMHHREREAQYVATTAVDEEDTKDMKTVQSGLRARHAVMQLETSVQAKDVDYQDSRMFAQVEVMNDDDAEEDPFVRLCEYRDDAQHPFIDSLVGRRVRVTVEVLP